MAAATKPRRLEYLPLDELTPHPENPKEHDPSLSEAIDRFGYTIPVLICERTGLLAAGHGRRDRLMEKRALGEDPPEGIMRRRDGTWTVPVIRGWSSESDDELLAYVITDNQQTIAGGWNVPVLAPILATLRDSDRGLDGVGFTSAQVDEILAAIPGPSGGGSDGDPDDDVDPEPPADPVTKPGDVWELGPHRLICGDSRELATYEALGLLDDPIAVAVTSPPYADRRKYDESTAFRPIHPDAYVEWFAPVAACIESVLADDGSWFVNINAGGSGLDKELYVYDLVLAHVREWGWHLVDEFCWERGGFPKQVRYRFKNQWESVFHFARNDFAMYPEAVAVMSKSAIAPGSIKPGDPLYGSPENWQGQSREPAASVSLDMQGVPGFEWFRGRVVEGLAFPGNRLPTFSGSHEALGHAAAFPVDLPGWFMRAYSAEGDRVLDPFAGSGSTLLAAHKESRVGFGIELSPGYCDVILRRWQAHSGERPRRRGKAVDFS